MLIHSAQNAKRWLTWKSLAILLILENLLLSWYFYSNHHAHTDGHNVTNSLRRRLPKSANELETAELVAKIDRNRQLKSEEKQLKKQIKYLQKELKRIQVELLKENCELNKDYLESYKEELEKRDKLALVQLGERLKKKSENIETERLWIPQGEEDTLDHFKREITRFEKWIKQKESECEESTRKARDKLDEFKEAVDECEERCDLEKIREKIKQDNFFPDVFDKKYKAAKFQYQIDKVKKLFTEKVEEWKESNKSILSTWEVVLADSLGSKTAQKILRHSEFKEEILALYKKPFLATFDGIHTMLGELATGKHWMKDILIEFKDEVLANERKKINEKKHMGKWRKTQRKILTGIAPDSAYKGALEAKFVELQDLVVQVKNHAEAEIDKTVTDTCEEYRTAWYNGGNPICGDI